MTTQQRPLRADAERTVRAILEAAERVLSANPAATLEQVAVAAGVARTTVHRRFATRDALLDALALWASEQMRGAVDDARPEASPPLVALYQATANALRIKSGWRFAMSPATAVTPAVAAVHEELTVRLDDLFRRVRDAGLLRADVDLVWARRAYHALVDEAVHGGVGDPDELATLVVRTLLHGIGTDAARL